MRVPLRWLSEYVDITLAPDELAHRLTIAGVEVGEIIRSGGDWDGLQVALVVDVQKHPNADRLRLATVDVGDAERPTVVCGAPNVAAGQKVAYAPVGAKLIDGQTGKPTVLKAAVIRGVESHGMVCSEKELGLSDEHEGILVLPEGSTVGAPLSSVLGDTVFDLDLTPNRPDLLSMLGVAREVAAQQGSAVRDPSLEYKVAGQSSRGRVHIEIRDPDLCPRYVGALVENIKLGDSPPWMQERLIAAGLRPISNVVDITNYVMLEIGQPLHAFDFKKLRKGTIIVRRAHPGEDLTLLDGTKQTLKPDMLVIADADKAIALAGVMGGADSEVTPKTTSILLEAANFNGPSVRRTSQALKLRTDASIRFEKGLSRHTPLIAAQRAVKLLVELCGGKAADGIVDVYPDKAKDVRVTLTQDRLHRVLGVELPTGQVRQILTSLGFTCRWVPPDRFVVRVPYWRTDVTIPEDVIEEIARILGYDTMPTTQLRGRIPDATPQPLLDLREGVRDVLAGAGMQEIINYSMSDLETLGKVLPAEDLAVTPPLRLANPMSRDFEYARTTLRHNLLQTLADNARFVPGMLSLFETGRVYIPRDGDLPQEIESLCAIISGRKVDRWGQPVKDPPALYDSCFFDAKGHLDRLLIGLRVDAEYRDAIDFAYLPGRTAELVIAGDVIGLIGQVHPRVKATFDLKGDVAMFELDLSKLLTHIPERVTYEPVSPYPPVQQDLALIVDESLPAARILALIRGSQLVRAVSVFDVYTGAPIPKGKKSMAFSITFQSPKKTLDDETVSRERERIVARLRSELNAEPRG